MYYLKTGTFDIIQRNRKQKLHKVVMVFFCSCIAEGVLWQKDWSEFSLPKDWSVVSTSEYQLWSMSIIISLFLDLRHYYSIQNENASAWWPFPRCALLVSILAQKTQSKPVLLPGLGPVCTRSSVPATGRPWPLARVDLDLWLEPCVWCNLQPNQGLYSFNLWLTTFSLESEPETYH